MKAFLNLETDKGIEETKSLIGPHLDNIRVELIEGDDLRPSEYANQYVEFFNLTGEHDAQTGDPKPMFSDVASAFRIILEAIIAFLLSNGLDDVDEAPEHKTEVYNDGLHIRTTFVYRKVCIALEMYSTESKVDVTIYDSEEDENPEWFVTCRRGWSEVFDFIEEQTY